MSERLDHEEDLPVIRLKMTSGELELTPENSSLYLFLGKLACYSHVFVETGRTEDDTNRMIGSYLFSNSDIFTEVADFMVSRGYPLHANLREVQDCDINAFDDMIAQQATDLDTIPDDWLEGGDGIQT